jgi:hypothetical protein
VFGHVFHIEEVVLNVPPTDEGALTRQNELFKVRFKSLSQNFGDKFSKIMNQADWTAVLHLGGLFCFRQKNEEGRV